MRFSRIVVGLAALDPPYKIARFDREPLLSLRSNCPSGQFGGCGSGWVGFRKFSVLPCLPFQSPQSANSCETTVSDGLVSRKGVERRNHRKSNQLRPSDCLVKLALLAATVAATCGPS